MRARYLLVIIVAVAIIFNFYNTTKKASHWNLKKIVINEFKVPEPKPQIEVKNKTITNLVDLFKPVTELTMSDGLFNIVATGDIMLSRRVNEISEERNNYNWMFENTKILLSTADLTIINLESPIAKNCSLFNSGMVFCARPENVTAINFAGVDVASIANNHAFDQKAEGFLYTVDLLNQNAILPIGFNDPNFKVVKKSKIGFTAFTELGCNKKYIGCLDKITVAEKIKFAKENSDYVIAFFHWGNEYTTKISSNQKLFARIAIDNGADIVLGSHPHWIQPVEFYKERLIVYSMGNFVFDQMWSTKTREGMALKLYIDKDRLIKVDFIPIIIEDYGRPKILEGVEKSEIVSQIYNMSKSILFT